MRLLIRLPEDAELPESEREFIAQSTRVHRVLSALEDAGMKVGYYQRGADIAFFVDVE